MTEGAREQDREVGRETARTAALIAWVLWILIPGFYVISFNFNGASWYMLLADLRSGSVEEIGGILVWNILGPAAPLGYATLGAVVVSLQPKNRIGWLCFVPGLMVVLLEGVGPLLADRLNVTFLMEWQSNSTFGVFLVGLLPVTLVLLIFPTGRLLSPRWRFAPWLAVGSTGLTVVAESLQGDHPMQAQRCASKLRLYFSRLDSKWTRMLPQHVGVRRIHPIPRKREALGWGPICVGARHSGIVRSGYPVIGHRRTGHPPGDDDPDGRPLNDQGPNG